MCKMWIPKTALPLRTENSLEAKEAYERIVVFKDIYYKVLRQRVISLNLQVTT